MLGGNVYYHGSIRKAIVSFGRLFSSIYIDRKQGDSVNGTTVQRLQIPISYAPKEKWLVRIDQQPDIENNVTMVTLPRMSFEIIGYVYDSTRKVNRMNKITATDTTNANNLSTAYTPVPYNLDISLYVITKTQEDGMQIIEQILPTFTPEYTMQVEMVPELGVTMPVPVILNSVSVVDEYDGDFQDRRYVTHTLNFEMKLNLFGPVTGQGIITKVDANIGENKDFSAPNRVYTATGNVVNATVSQEDWTTNF
jgi:hypothetical protein